MTTREVHIRIQEGLQSLGSFLYSDLGSESVDLLIEAFMYKMVREVLSNERAMKFTRTGRNNQFADNELLRSDISTLEIRDKELTVSVAHTRPNCLKWVLPTVTNEEFLHLISSASELTKGVCAGIISANRDYHTESVNHLLGGNLTKPTSESPIANHDNVYLYTYTDGSFTINKVYINYIRKPSKPDYKNAPTAEISFSPSGTFKLIERILQWSTAIGEQNQAKQAAINFISAQTQ